MYVSTMYCTVHHMTLAAVSSYHNCYFNHAIIMIRSTHNTESVWLRVLCRLVLDVAINFGERE